MGPFMLPVDLKEGSTVPTRLTSVCMPTEQESQQGGGNSLAGEKKERMQGRIT